MSKDESGASPSRAALRVRDKPDSQEICFVPDGAYASVVGRPPPADRSAWSSDAQAVFSEGTKACTTSRSASGRASGFSAPNRSTGELDAEREAGAVGRKRHSTAPR